MRAPLDHRHLTTLLARRTTLAQRIERVSHKQLGQAELHLDETVKG